MSIKDYNASTIDFKLCILLTVRAPLGNEARDPYTTSRDTERVIESAKACENGSSGGGETHWSSSHLRDQDEEMRRECKVEA